VFVGNVDRDKELKQGGCRIARRLSGTMQGVPRRARSSISSTAFGRAVKWAAFLPPRADGERARAPREDIGKF